LSRQDAKVAKKAGLILGGEPVLPLANGGFLFHAWVFLGGLGVLAAIVVFHI
jgi:hypothetical protein